MAPYVYESRDYTVDCRELAVHEDQPQLMHNAPLFVRPVPPGSTTCHANVASPRLQSLLLRLILGQMETRLLLTCSSTVFAT